MSRLQENNAYKLTILHHLTCPGKLEITANKMTPRDHIFVVPETDS